jgi:hypothetical protein
MSYKDKGEITREYYRRQGEQRERERILEIIRVEMADTQAQELITLIESKNENRIAI